MKIFQFIFITILALFSLVMHPGSTPVAHAKVLASAEVFEVTESYLDSLENYYESAGFSSSQDQYLSQAIRFKILAHEAREMGIDPYPVNVDHWDYDQENQYNRIFIEDVGLAEAYVSEMINDYPVEDKVVVSYYRSNPAHFQEGAWSDADILPLDSDLKMGIKLHILETVKGQIAGDIYDDLKKKYEVHTHE